MLKQINMIFLFKKYKFKHEVKFDSIQNNKVITNMIIKN